MKFQLTINLGNDAMQDDADVATALRTLAHLLDRDGFPAASHGIRDANGNTVGTWAVSA